MDVAVGAFLTVISGKMMQINVWLTGNIGLVEAWKGFYPFYPFTVFLNG